MKDKVYKKKDGTDGHNYSLEDGDVFTPTYDKATKSDKGMFPSWFISAVYKGQEIFINLSPTQAAQINELGDAEGKELEAYAYKSKKFKRDCIGIKIKGEKRGIKLNRTETGKAKILLKKKETFTKEELEAVKDVEGFLADGASDEDIKATLEASVADGGAGLSADRAIAVLNAAKKK